MALLRSFRRANRHAHQMFCVTHGSGSQKEQKGYYATSFIWRRTKNHCWCLLLCSGDGSEALHGQRACWKKLRATARLSTILPGKNTSIASHQSRLSLVTRCVVTLYLRLQSSRSFLLRHCRRSCQWETEQHPRSSTSSFYRSNDGHELEGCK